MNARKSKSGCSILSVFAFTLVSMGLHTQANGNNLTLIPSNVPFIDISASGTPVGGILDDSEHTIQAAMLGGFPGNGLLAPNVAIRIGNNGCVLWGISPTDTFSNATEIGFINASPFGTPNPFMAMIQSNTTQNGNGGIGPRQLLAALWDDHSPGTGNSIRYQRIGNDLIVQWTNEDHFNAAGTGVVTFEMIVHGGVPITSGNSLVDFVYQDTLYNTNLYQNDGGSATIGFKNWGINPAGNDAEFGQGGGNNTITDPAFGQPSMQPKVGGWVAANNPGLPHSVSLMGKQPAVIVPAGQDCWHTQCGSTSYDFANTPIPCSFFDPGSEPFDGLLLLGGGDPGGVDTRMNRLDSMSFSSFPSNDSTPIELASLNLVSCTPIIVRYCDGGANETWNVSVTLSSVGPPPPPGMMSVTKTHANGGTFSSQFFVQPKFTFTRIGDGAIRVLDTGAEFIPPILLDSTIPAPWVHTANIPINPVCGVNFVPGVQEANAPPGPGSSCVSTAQCCKPVCHDGPGHQHCTGCPGGTDCPCGACCDAGNGNCTEISAPDPAATCLGMGGLFKGIGSSCSSTDGDTIPNSYETNDCCFAGNCAGGSLCTYPTDPSRGDTDGDGLFDNADPAPCNRCMPLGAPNRPAICDQFDLTLPGDGDCDNNGICDLCAIQDGSAHDCNRNGVPDTCEPDCNSNSTPDDYDITCGSSLDGNGNNIPDECETVGGACCLDTGECVIALSAIDCSNFQGQYKGNGTNCNDSDADFIPDIMETNNCGAPYIPHDVCVTRTSPFLDDSDSDGILDGDEIYSYGSNPCVPDADCNGNGAPDLVEINMGSREDRNGNLILDVCEFPPCSSLADGDTTGDGNLDGRDIQRWVDCFIGDVSSCHCADMNADTFVNTADIPILVTTLLATAAPGPRCDNCHAVATTFWECHHWADDANGAACSTKMCIENTIATATCDFHPGNSGARNCNTNTANGPKAVQRIHRSTCPGGTVNWVVGYDFTVGCTTCSDNSLYVSCVVSPCTSNLLRGPFDRGGRHACGCP